MKDLSLSPFLSLSPALHATHHAYPMTIYKHIFNTGTQESVGSLVFRNSTCQAASWFIHMYVLWITLTVHINILH